MFLLIAVWPLTFASNQSHRELTFVQQRINYVQIDSFNLRRHFSFIQQHGENVLRRYQRHFIPTLHRCRSNGGRQERSPIHSQFLSRESEPLRQSQSRILAIRCIAVQI